MSFGGSPCVVHRTSRPMTSAASRRHGGLLHAMAPQPSTRRSHILTIVSRSVPSIRLTRTAIFLSVPGRVPRQGGGTRSISPRPASHTRSSRLMRLSRRSCPHVCRPSTANGAASLGGQRLRRALPALGERPRCSVPSDLGPHPFDVSSKCRHHVVEKFITPLEERTRACSPLHALRILPERVAVEVVALQIEIHRPARTQTAMPESRATEDDDIAGTVLDLDTAHAGECPWGARPAPGWLADQS
jgi:hypothetical protein